MTLLVWVTKPFMQPQVSDLQSFSCLSLVFASLGFVYQSAWLARAALVAPVMLVLMQVRCPDCTEALAERCYKDLASQLLSAPARAAPTRLHVQLLRLSDAQ